MIKIKFALLITAIFSNVVFGALIYENSMDGSNTDEWTISRGSWDYSSGTLTNTFGGENRIFTNVDVSSDEYTIEFTGNLISGKGWGFFFGSELSESNKVSGMNFQYDAGWGKGAYLLRKWDNNKESVVAYNKSTLDINQVHNFTLNISSSGFSAYQDGIEVLSYEGEMNLAGSLIGIRTWSTKQAEFGNISVSDANPVPEPATLALVTLGSLCIMKRRKV